MPLQKTILKCLFPVSRSHLFWQLPTQENVYTYKMLIKVMKMYCEKKLTDPVKDIKISFNVTFDKLDKLIQFSILLVILCLSQNL